MTVGLEGTGSCVQIQVTDTGMYVPSDHLNLIFERFRQGGASKTRWLGGLGLGLTISRSHDATILDANHLATKSVDASEFMSLIDTCGLPLSRSEADEPASLVPRIFPR